MGYRYTLTDLVAEVLGGLSTVISTVKAGVNAAWDGIKAAGQFVIANVLQLMIEMMVTAVTEFVRGLLMTAEAVLGSGLAYTEQAGLFDITVAGRQITFGIKARQQGISLTFGNKVLIFSDFFGNTAMDVETLSIDANQASFDVLLKRNTIEWMLVGIAVITGGLLAVGKYDWSSAVFFGSLIVAGLANLKFVTDYFLNPDIPQNFKRLVLNALVLFEVTQMLNLLVLILLPKMDEVIQLVIGLVIDLFVFLIDKNLDVFYLPSIDGGLLFSAAKFTFLTAGLLLRKKSLAKVEDIKVDPLSPIDQRWVEKIFIKNGKPEVTGRGGVLSERQVMVSQHLAHQEYVQQKAAADKELGMLKAKVGLFMKSMVIFHLLMAVIYLFVYWVGTS